MMFPDLWSASQWLVPAGLLMLFVLVALGWSYARSRGSVAFRLAAASCKAIGFGLLVLCLLEPVISVQRPKSGANLFMVLADASQSLQVKDRNQNQTREQQVRDKLVENVDWQDELAGDFDLRRYQFDRQLTTSDFASFRAAGIGSSIINSLATVADRYRDRPKAGILLITDGNATDTASSKLDWAALPPVYPVVVGSDKSARDISISRLSVSQTNFETAPVSVAVELRCHGYNGRSVVVELLEESGKSIDRQVIASVEDDRPFALRFQLRPEQRGVSVYRVRAFEEGAASQFTDEQQSREATLVNNQRLAVIDRAKGPYRVLYVGGRPNWEFKFLRRSLLKDDEIELVGLLRIAKKEPKFTFRGHLDETTNPLFRGFGNQADEQAEQYDEPVLIRLGTKDSQELRYGFPKSAEELFQYQAIILDDIEAEYFTQEQKSLIQQFVSARGGGLLMLGGQESFAPGNYDRTPIGELLPVYLGNQKQPIDVGQLRLSITRDGWLQPWVRIESTEEAELERLQDMPGFQTINSVNSIKPGATVLANATDQRGRIHPALVVQRFGQGRSAAGLLGDMWRWQLTSEMENNDLMKAWRQTVRWLVADVPRRVDARVQHLGDANLTVNLLATVNDESYKPLDNATVSVTVTKPDGKQVALSTQPLDTTAGRYGVNFVPRQPGAYRAVVKATSADGQELGQRQVGWVTEPANDEFRRLAPNRNWLNQIAQQTGGEVIELDDLDSFVSSLPSRNVPVMETRIFPWWHTWSLFLIAVSLLIAEWGMRRWKGLP